MPALGAPCPGVTADQAAVHKGMLEKSLAQLDAPPMTIRGEWVRKIPKRSGYLSSSMRCKRAAVGVGDELGRQQDMLEQSVDMGQRRWIQ